ncbi:MAG: hypothetical protein HFE49_09800 [Clostridia bacterium]|nr:hypothetical protein [Clostridia bacterium]
MDIKKIAAVFTACSLVMSIPVFNIFAEDSFKTETISGSGDENEIEIEDNTENTPEPIVTQQPNETEMQPPESNETNEDDPDTPSGISGLPGAAGGTGFTGSKFRDCRGHWAEQIIIESTDKKYLDGYDDGTFKPDNPVSAAEFAKIYNAWKGNFYQLTSGYWATPYIRILLDNGMFENGDYSDYGEKMTREKVAKAIVNSLKGEYFPSNLQKYYEIIPDCDSIDDEYRDYAVKTYISGIISGYEDGSFKPDDYVTRAEILSIIDRAIHTEKRVIPEIVQNAKGGERQTNTYYTAAVQVRKSTNGNTMNYRLLSGNARYMENDDEGSGLKLSEEFQGAQGFAFLMRFDLSDILKRENELQSVKLTLKRAGGGDMDMGLFMYDTPISDTDWNSADYSKVVNGAAVAGDNKAGYNAVVDNISQILPTWGNIGDAVPQEQKTQPFAQAKCINDRYDFELDINELKKYADKDNVIEFFATTVNYDRYGMEQDNKPKCFVAGKDAPSIYCAYNTDGEMSSVITLLADTALVEGGMLNILGTGTDAYIENFRTEQKITFNFKADMTGKYKMTVYYAANINSGGGSASFNINGTSFDHTFAQTGSWSTYVYEDLGEVELQAGENTLVITDKEIPNTYLINIKNIVFEKVN